MRKLTIENATLSRGIETQHELKVLIEKKTGVDMRNATISDFYRDNKGSINKNHLATIMQSLEITDFNEFMAFD